MLNIHTFNYILLPIIGFIIGYNHYNFTNFIFTGLIIFYYFSTIRFYYQLQLDKFIIFYMIGITLQTIEILPVFSGCCFGLFLLTGINDHKQHNIANFFKNIDAHFEYLKLHIHNFIKFNKYIKIISNIFKKKDESSEGSEDSDLNIKLLDDNVHDQFANFSDDDSINSTSNSILEGSQSSLNLNYII
jgi:hypothetical protein